MANTFIDAKGIGLIGREAQFEWKNNNTFLATATREYDGMYDDNKYYQPGTTIYVRLPNNYLTQTGDTVTVGDVKERYVPVNLEQILSVPLAYTVTELTTSVGAMENWKNRVLYPAMRALSSQLNYLIAQKAKTQVSLYTGDAAAHINAYSVVDNAGAVLDEHACSRSLKRYASLAVRESAALRQASTLQNMFNQVINKDITLNSQLGLLAGFDMFVEQSIPYHTTYSGSRAGVTVKTNVTSGATTIVLTGLTVSTTGIVKAGDVITFTGIYSVNPITLQSTGQTYQAVVTADADSDGSGDATITVGSPVIHDTTNPNRNVSSQIVATTAVTFVASHHVNLAWAEDGLVVVCPKLAPLDTPYSAVVQDPDTGYSLTLSKSAEILDNKNILRLNILWGATWMADRAVRILSL